MNLDPEIYTERTLEMFRHIYNFAAKMRHGFIGSEHVLWGIAREGGAAARELNIHGLDTALIESYLQEHDRDASEAHGGTQLLQFSAEAERVFTLAEAQAARLEHSMIEPEHLLLAILQEKNCAAYHLIQSLGVDADEMKNELLSDVAMPSLPVALSEEGQMTALSGERANAQLEGPEEDKEEEQEDTDDSVLTKYGHDLTREARDGRLDPMIGRGSEVDQVIRILSRRKKNNPVLVGEPGVGKTAIAEGLAERIVEERVPEGLLGKRIISLDLTGMLSGTRFRGDFEERIKSFLDEAVAEGNVILFIDELHTLIGAGSGDGALDAANILKPELARGELRIIGATTPQEYTRYIEKDAALERRFQPVTIEEPSEEEAVRILMGLKPEYESFHQVTVTDEAVRAAVTLSSRYIQDRFLPDKAIDLMDEAAARIKSRNTSVPQELEPLGKEIRKLSRAKKKAAQTQDFEEADLLKKREEELSSEFHERRTAWRDEQNNCVDVNEIAEVVSEWTKIPVAALSQDDRTRLRSLEDILHARVIGQDDAVSSVARAIRRSRTGVTDPGRPIASFLFLGPTGVGKTELCRTLAEAMFQDEDALIRFDMSEYSEPYTVSRLIGSPPGYVGHEEGGQLTEQVRRKPYSIVLLDEIEKANHEVWNTLLQIMDDGRLTDSKGRMVSFKNTILIMTSNLGAREITGKSSLGFSAVPSETGGLRQEDMKERVMDAVKQAFPPEFINRLDEVIVFHSLEKEHIREIADHMISRLIHRMQGQGVDLSVSEDVAGLLAEKGYDPMYGARPLRRTIQSMLEDKLADYLLEIDSVDGCQVEAVLENGEISLKPKSVE